jgi:ketosteroid isomerase-like protein
VVGSAARADVRAEIEAANRAFEAAIAKGDSKAASALYTASGQVLAPGMDLVSGPEAIMELWQANIDAGVKKIRLETLEAEGAGDAAHEVGRFELLDAEGKTIDRGNYVVIWKKEGGRFKLHRDIFNTSIPPSK